MMVDIAAVRWVAYQQIEVEVVRVTPLYHSVHIGNTVDAKHSSAINYRQPNNNWMLKNAALGASETTEN